MQVDVISIKELNQNLKQKWLVLQTSNPRLAGPCFHPELYAAVGKFYPEIYTALLSSGEGVVGFLPFLKDHQNSAAKKIPHCDYEAIIAGPGRLWDMDRILKKMGVNAWDYNALTDFQGICSHSAEREAGQALRVDLTQGFRKYLGALRKGRLGESDLMRNHRVLERTLGPIRFEPDCGDAKLLGRMVQWKVARYNLDAAWGKLTNGLFEYMAGLKDPLFKGVVSTLYAGDELLAVNFGIRYQMVFNGMMMAFDPKFTKYSTGQLLLCYMISGYKALGFRILDAGPGDSPYKKSVANSAVPFVRGTFRIHTLKERIKSVDWLYKGLIPFVHVGRDVIHFLS